MNGGIGKVILLSLDGFVGVWTTEGLEPHFSRISFPGIPISASFEP